MDRRPRRRRRGFAFGITEPDHGSDATHMETTPCRDGDEWVINGEKTWNTGIHKATNDMIFARTSGKAGDGHGITAFLVPTDAPGFKVEEYLWTFNMPTDHAHISLTNVRVRTRRSSAVRAAASVSCSTSSTRTGSARRRPASGRRGSASPSRSKYAQERKPFGKPLASNQAIQFPLVELHTQCEMLQALIRKTAWLMDRTVRSRSPTRCRCATTGRTGCAARRPTGRCRCTAGSGTRGTSRSSTSTAITAATGSPRAPRRSRCAGSRATCSASCPSEAPKGVSEE